MIPHPHRGDVGTDGFDDAGAFMAQHERAVQREAAVAVHHVEVAVADAGGDGTHQHLATPGLVDLDGLDGQWFVDFPKYGGVDLHGARFLRWLVADASAAWLGLQCGDPMPPPLL